MSAMSIDDSKTPAADTYKIPSESEYVNDGSTQDMDDFEDDSEMTPNEIKPNGCWGILRPLNDENKTLFMCDESKRYTVGRQSVNDLVFEHSIISGCHCAFYKETGVVFVEDLSTNGTFIGNEKIGKRKKRLLNSGTIITIAKRNDKQKCKEISYIYIDAKEDEKGGIYEDYVLKEILGSGAFATVRRGVHKLNHTQHAIKIISKKKFSKSAEGRKHDLKDEVSILQKIKHENVVGIDEVYESDDDLFLVLELVSGGELLDFINEKQLFSEDEARPLVKQMLGAIDYLHSNGIAHRDLKFENILLKDQNKDVIKITDFGLSRIVGEGAFMSTICGTPEYLAPEVLTAAKNTGYSKAVDMWSMGVIFYTMLTGLRPFAKTGNRTLFDVVKAGQYSYPNDVVLSNLAKNLIDKMLTLDPAARITANDALNHAWTVLEDEEEEEDLPVAPQVGKKRSRTDANLGQEGEVSAKKSK